MRDENHLEGTGFQNGQYNFSGMHFEELQFQMCSPTALSVSYWTVIVPKIVFLLYLLLKGKKSLLMIWLEKLHFSFPGQSHCFFSGGFHQQLHRVQNFTFLSFLSLGQVLPPSWPTSSIFLIGSGRKKRVASLQGMPLKKEYKSF